MVTNEDLFKLMSEVQADVKGIKNTIESVKSDISTLKSELCNLDQKCTDLEKKVTVLCKNAQREDCAKNILIFKANDTDEFNKNLITSVREILRQAEVDIPDTCIISTHRIGKNPGSRPILIKLIAPRWKKAIYDKIDNFKTMGLSIANDIPQEDRLINKRLMRARYLLKQEQKNPVLRGTSLFVNNQRLTDHEIDELLAKYEETNQTLAHETIANDTTQAAMGKNLISNETATLLGTPASIPSTKKRPAEQTLMNYFNAKPRLTQQPQTA